MSEITKILNLTWTKKATDIHIVAGSPVLLRVEDDLLAATREALTCEAARELSYCLLIPEQIAEFENYLDLDFMTSDRNHDRYRVNISHNDGEVGAVIRLLASAPLPLEQASAVRASEPPDQRPQGPDPHHGQHQPEKNHDHGEHDRRDQSTVPQTRGHDRRPD